MPEGQTAMQSTGLLGDGVVPRSLFVSSQGVTAAAVGLPLPLSRTVRLGNYTITQKRESAFYRVIAGHLPPGS